VEDTNRRPIQSGETESTTLQLYLKSYETRDNLEQLNAVDIKLYRELSDCLNDGHYAFREWQPDRVAVESFNATEAKIRKNIAKAEKKRLKTAKEG
jgi:hypothetical protein